MLLKEPYLTRATDWVRALRSGLYAQDRRQLKSSLGYCCLGVACDASGLGEWDHVNRYLGAGALLPTEVVMHYGLMSPSAVFNANSLYASGCVTLCSLNDTANFNFSQIASFIERAISDPNIRLFREECYE